MKNLNIKKRCALQYYFSRLYGRTDFVDCVHSVSDLRFNLQYSIFNSEVYFALRGGGEVLILQSLVSVFNVVVVKKSYESGDFF